MSKYKLFIYKYNNLERSLLSSLSTVDEWYILRDIQIEKSVIWYIYDIDTEDVFETKTQNYGKMIDYSAMLFNKLFVNNKNVISYEQFKDVIKPIERSVKGPFEVRYWDIIYWENKSLPCVRIVSRDLSDGEHRYYVLCGSYAVRKYIDLLKPIVLQEIDPMEFFAIKAIAGDGISYSITKKEFKRYNSMSREEAVEELAIEYINSL